METDSIFLANLSNNNNRIIFLLSIIYSFTKKAWIYPRKKKNSDVILKAFKTFIKDVVKVQRSFLTLFVLRGTNWPPLTKST